MSRLSSIQRKDPERGHTRLHEIMRFKCGHKDSVHPDVKIRSTDLQRNVSLQPFFVLVDRFRFELHLLSVSFSLTPSLGNLVRRRTLRRTQREPQ